MGLFEEATAEGHLDSKVHSDLNQVLQCKTQFFRLILM